MAQLSGQSSGDDDLRMVARDALAAHLNLVGFYANALDLNAGRLTRATLIERLHRDANGVVPECRDARLALAEDLTHGIYIEAFDA